MISSTTNNHIIFLCITFMVCCYCYSCSAKDNITTSESINDGLDYILESEGMKFQMGFFSPENNTSEVRRYVGIWYKEDPKIIVWVANRDTPVPDSTGVLTVAEDGNLKVLDKDATVYFNTTIVLPEGAPQTAVKLYDNGNAVLINLATKKILWQSFEFPTDTFLPGMKMGKDMNLTSWKSATDPGSGSFVFQTETETDTDQYVIMNGSTTRHWKSGKRSIDSFDDNQISSNAFNLLSNATKQVANRSERNGTVKSFKTISLVELNNTVKSYKTISLVEPNSRLVMGHDGRVQYFSQPILKSEWVEPKDACSVYKVCGPFGMCNVNNNSPNCSCLRGFKPISPDDPTRGCKITSEICDSTSNGTFVNISMISMDDTTLRIHESRDELECKQECLKDCTCLAYSYTYPNKSRIWDPSRGTNKVGCWLWNTEPINLKGHGTHNISFRVSESSKGCWGMETLE